MDEEVYENPNKNEDRPQENVSKPTKAFYLLPIFVGLLGGIIGYFIVRDKDKKMATNLLIVGCIISFIGFLSSGFFILAYYGIFAPSGFIGPTTNGFPVVQIVSPWDMKSNGELTLILENKVGEGIQIKKIYVNGREASFSIFSLNLADGERSNPIIVNTDQGGNTGSNYAIDLSIEYCIVEAGCSNNFNSTGSISGTYS